MRNVPAVTWMAIALVASAPLLGQTPSPSTTGDIVGKLTGFQPWLADFEAIVGPLDRDRSIWEEATGPVHRNRASGPIEHIDVAFSIDFYHFDPREEQNVELASWNVLFRDGEAEARERLRQRFGDGSALDYAVGHPRRFGDLYLTSLQDGRFELAWYAEEPEWAVPVRDSAGERALVDRIVGLLRSGVRDQTIAASFAPPSPLPGRSTLGAQGPDWRLEVSPGRAGRPDWVSIKVRGAPLDAGPLIAFLRLAEPGMLATDVHLSGPYLADLANGKRPGVDGYRVTVEIDHELLESVPAKRPATAQWKPKAWRIRGVWLSRDASR
jgi:hypothetical protein